MSRVAILCPGRGSYTRRTLHSLPAEDPLVARAEELRQEYGLGSLVALDAARRFDPLVHLRAENVSPLIYLVTYLDCARVAAEHEVVCVAGNSMGWYSALAVAGALSFEDGFRLVQEMAVLQQEHGDGGQVLYPLIDDQWRVDPRQEERVAAALAAADGQAFPSIELGGYVVCAGTEEGVRRLLAELPAVEMGPTPYPARLAGHGPYHTPLLHEVSAKAAQQLGRLGFRAPARPLVDGRGAQFSPYSTDPEALRDYTLGQQVTTPFRFTTSVRVALREYAPDLFVLPGPGNTLGGITGQILVAEGWRAIHSRADFEAAQSSPHPPVLSLRR